MDKKQGKNSLLFYVFMMLSIFLIYIGASIMSQGGLYPRVDRYLGPGLTGLGFIFSVICYAIKLRKKQAKDSTNKNK